MVCRSCNKSISENAFMCPGCGEPYEIKQILSTHSQRLGLLSEALGIMLDSQAYLLSASGRAGDASAQKLAQGLSDISSKLNKAQQSVQAPKLTDTSKISISPTIVAKPTMTQSSPKTEAALFEKPPTQKIVLEKSSPVKPMIQPITEPLAVKKAPLEGGTVASIKVPAPKMAPPVPAIDDDVVTFEIEMSPKVEAKPQTKVKQSVVQKNEEVDLFDLG
jgi:hypothetical protein